jgi:hypothetical protein
LGPDLLSVSGRKKKICDSTHTAHDTTLISVCERKQRGVATYDDDQDGRGDGKRPEDGSPPKELAHESCEVGDIR